MSKFMIIFMVFIPFQVISLKMMSGDDRYSPRGTSPRGTQGLICPEGFLFLDITVFTARGKMPREVKGQHVAQIPAVL